MTLLSQHDNLMEDQTLHTLKKENCQIRHLVSLLQFGGMGGQ